MPRPRVRPDEDAGRHKREPHDEERPAGATDRRYMPVRQLETSQHPTDDGRDDDEKAPPLYPFPLRAEATTEARDVFAQGEEAKERPEDDVRSWLLVRRRHELCCTGSRPGF